MVNLIFAFINTMQTTKKFYIKEDTARLSSIKRTYNI